MALIETVETAEHHDELDSRVELTELGVQAMQIARIETALTKRELRASLAYEGDTMGWTMAVYTTTGEVDAKLVSFVVHGMSVIDVLAQAAQVLEVG